jgi:hypothetical protein
MLLKVCFGGTEGGMGPTTGSTQQRARCPMAEQMAEKSVALAGTAAAVIHPTSQPMVLSTRLGVARDKNKSLAGTKKLTGCTV